MHRRCAYRPRRPPMPPTEGSAGSLLGRVSARLPAEEEGAVPKVFRTAGWHDATPDRPRPWYRGTRDRGVHEPSASGTGHDGCARP